jgi:UDP-N-acetylmuramate--alanine ligase
MKALPLDIGKIHFVGIGGIGMSGIAEILHNLGYAVQGSDLVDGANVHRLQQLGISVEIGHKPENLGDAQVVVISSAVKSDNSEVVAARTRLIPVVRRAEMLGELMRLKWSIAVAGTHGKTTTTSMIGALLDAAQLDPTVINGGIINAYGTNARLGAGDWMVVEADESDGTFVKLPATIAVVTNIDPEHLRGGAARIRELCRKHPVLRLRHALRRSPGGAGSHPQARRAARGDLRIVAASGCARGQH